MFNVWLTVESISKRFNILLAPLEGHEAPPPKDTALRPPVHPIAILFANKLES
jgi:hypothetical protein